MKKHTVQRTLALAMTIGWTAATATDLNPVTLKETPEHPPIPLAETGEAKITLCMMNASGNGTEKLAVAELKDCFQNCEGSGCPDRGWSSDSA